MASEYSYMTDFCAGDEASARRLYAWEQLDYVSGKEPKEWRQDAYGRAIYYPEYGKRDSDFGWEVDHIIPLAEGGEDIVANLRALHWQSNLERRG